MPFVLGNILSCFVPGGANRKKVRSATVMFFYKPIIKRFIKKNFNERAHSMKFVRQMNIQRLVCLVNDKYYVKIFSKVPNKKLQEFKRLVDYITPYMDVLIPTVFVDKKHSMYVCKKIENHSIYDFDRELILQNEDKIKKQVIKIIDNLQSINVKDIPNYEKYMIGIQKRSPGNPDEKPSKMVLGHFDISETNLLFDDNFNIHTLIDWDALSITDLSGTDLYIFQGNWQRFINRISRNKKKVS